MCIYKIKENYSWLIVLLLALQQWVCICTELTSDPSSMKNSITNFTNWMNTCPFFLSFLIILCSCVVFNLVISDNDLPCDDTARLRTRSTLLPTKMAGLERRRSQSCNRASSVSALWKLALSITEYITTNASGGFALSSSS